MPVTPTYPGVYIEEIPSGVRTIVGVATSITAFVGKAMRGPIDKAERALSFGEFARKFGGLSASSEMSHAVQQFFRNGGNEAWIVRIAKGAVAAKVKDGLKTRLGDQDEKLFEVTAKYAGKVGNSIKVEVDYDTRNKGSTFNLIAQYEPADNPSDARAERFPDLSMRKDDSRYVARIVSQLSELIQIEEVLDAAKRKTALDAAKGTLESGELVDDQGQLLDLTKLVTNRSNQCQVQVNGLPAVTVTLDPQNDAADGDTLCAAIQTAVRNAGNQDALKNFTCQFQNNKIVMTSGEAGEASRVEVSPGVSNDAYGKLKLSFGDGAMQKDAVAVLRPLEGSSVLEDGDEKDFDVTQEPQFFAPNPVAGKTPRQGIYALEAVDLFNLLCLPGMRDPDILDRAAKYCEDRRAFLIADAPGGDETSAVAPDHMERVIAGTSYPKTQNGAVFYPWIRVGDTLRPPSGTVAGLMARIDATRGVWKAPAGTEATLRGVRGLEYVLTDNENGVLNPRGVNCIRQFPGYGIVVWGSRTLLGDDAQASEWKYIPIRRLALFIEETLYRNTKWVVFEPNDEPLWAQIRLNIGAFMHNLFRQGAFQGTTPREAYFVKCDKETTTQNDINLGIVNIVVGFAPLKPAEFVIIKIQQMAGQIEA